MAVRLETDLLSWINEESNNAATRAQAPVPIQLLVMRMALALRPDYEDLSLSIELALKTYEKAELLRVLRHFERKDWINFVDQKGTKIVITDEQFSLGRGYGGLDPTYVSITDKGKAQAMVTKVAESPSSE